MRNWMVIAAVGLALAGCDQAAEESDDPMPGETVAVADEGMAGTYEFELNGTPTTAVLMADGMYTDSQDGKVVEAGLWEERDDGKVCFDPAGDDTPATCFAIGETAEDGSFVATPDQGDPLTIRKVR